MSKARIKFEREYKGYDLYKSPDCEGIMGVFRNPQNERAFVYNINMCCEYYEEEINAMIEHEIGHIVLNHKPYERSLKDEISADLYAVEQLGIDIVLQTLNLTLDNVFYMNDNFAKQEIRARINAIIKHNEETS